MRRFFPFAALLGVALVLGCQDVGTGPDGLLLAAGENFPFVADEKVTARRPRTGRGG